jgi:hypothetical protein
LTLELSKLTGQMQVMGETVAARRRRYTDLVALARRWLTDYADQGPQLRHPARSARAAIPTDEPFDAVHPLPPSKERFTVAAVDGSQIHPDPHGAAFYHLVNIGSLVYRHGSGQAPEPHSEPALGYTEDDLYESDMLVAGNLLDVRRDLAEISHLAEICVSEEPESTVALVDGSIILWVLTDLPKQGRERKVASYLEQLDRIRTAGAVVGGFISRPRRSEVTRLLYLASIGGNQRSSEEKPNPLEHLPDRAVFQMLPPGARSALFISPSPINNDYYSRAGHTVQFFYLNLSKTKTNPIIARVEAPAWVVENPHKLSLLHSAIVAQAHITGDYPYALARADELAYISGQERRAFDEMVKTALLQAGVRSDPSPKAYYKDLTRRGRRKYGI